MKITRITTNNAACFSPLLFGEAQFDTPSRIRLGVADDNNRVAGAIAMETAGPYYEILSLYVLPEFRRQGYGTALVNAVKTLVKGTEKDAIVIFFGEDPVLSSFLTGENFDCDVRCGQFSFSKRIFSSSRFYQRFIANQNASDIKTVAELDNRERKAFYNILVQEGLRTEGWYDPEFSTVVLNGITVTGALFCVCKKNTVDVVYFYNASHKQSDAVKHIRKLIDALDANYPKNQDFRISFIGENISLVLFLSGILGGTRFMNLEQMIMSGIFLM